MASLCISLVSGSRCLPATVYFHHSRASSNASSSFRFPKSSLSFSGSPDPAAWLSGDLGYRRRTDGGLMVARAGPSINSYIFAFVLPLSLILATVITAMRIGHKLDRKYLEELAIDQAIKEAEEDEDDADATAVAEEEETAAATIRRRSRPKR